MTSGECLRLCLLLSAVAAFSGCKRQQARAMPSGPPPVPVSVARAERESVPLELRVVGAIEASSTVQIKSQVAGQLLTVHFTEGQNVAENQLLFEIDSRPYPRCLEIRFAELHTIISRFLAVKLE